MGANSELKELGTFLRKNHKVIAERASKLELNWHFIPPHAPHFGGIWEASVKSIKCHLRRVAGNASLTFEEMYTLLTQIESVLNSRPLCPLSADPNDLDPLTPAHFLIGRPLVSLPDPDLSMLPENRLTQFQRVQQLLGHFWRRWHQEYLVELQTRTKWPSNRGSLREGDLVLLKVDNQPPLLWKLGRIITLHPGKDNISRVATVKTNNGVIKRAFSKLCPLPGA